MSLLDDLGALGRRTAESFLSLDDLVAGQGLASGTVDQAENAGRLALGTAAVSTHLAARSMLLGVQASAKTARATAASLRGLVPGIRAAEELAERIDERAARAGDEASRLVSWTVELVGGEAAAPRNPLTHEPWLAKSAPPGYGWTELAADTAKGPLWRTAVLPAEAGTDTLRAAAGTGAGRLAVRTGLTGANTLLDLWPGEGAGEPGGTGRGELREALLALVTASGTAAVWGSLPVGLVDVARVGRWVRDDGVEGRGGAGSAPRLVALCESELGRAEDGPTSQQPEPAVQLARDTAFQYSRDALGRKPALARVERLFGREARERIEADVSLGWEDSPELLSLDPGAPTDRALRARIDAIGDRRELARLQARCTTGLATLERFTRLPWVYVPRRLHRRIGLLRAFIHLAEQDLALDASRAADATAKRLAAWRRFEAFAQGG